ncbi:hypothetical protein EC968_008654, partial [Mortierella alpina]
MRKTLSSLVGALGDDPTEPVSKLEVLPKEERRLLLEDWNATRESYPDELCLHQLFEQQVERTPEAIAIVHEDLSMTYSELNTRANSLAHRLVGLDIQPDTPVAICVERSPALIVGMLAILKAGGAYVPLDPLYASDRLKDIISDAAPSVLLVDRVGREVLSETLLSSLTTLDPNTLENNTVGNPHAIGLSPQHLAYIIYTSGSTGKPKGVMIEHQGAVSYITAQQRRNLQIQSSSRMVQFASLSFDGSVLEVFGTLCFGGSLHLLQENVRLDLDLFWRYLNEHHITHALLTPSLLQDCEKLPSLSSMSRLLVGGEALPMALVKKLHKLVPAGAIINEYGPTEATVAATSWTCLENCLSENAPIGRPLANRTIYLLDSNHHPVPFGAIGEIFIGGVGIARGYLNRPDLTAATFVPDAFSNESKARMYKTGDLARYLPDGNLVYMGRSDHQIKIRGFRIELGEIETRLHEHPLVSDAVVVALDEGSNKRLVAYVIMNVTEDNGSHAVAGFRSHLALKLPEYMVPAAFVRLDSFPLTPNGKLDRRALPAPGANDYARQEYEAPQGEVELGLASVWSELLQIDKRLWFLAQMDGVSNVYHIPIAFRLHGSFNKTAWQQALDELYSRHEALRSVFININGQPQVQILPAKGIPLRYTDLRNTAGKDMELRRIAEEEVSTPFGLTQEASIRAAVVQLSDDDHVVFITMHHIVSDGWSSGIIVREICQLYTAYCKGEPSPLAPLAIQYPDFAAWQRQWLSRDRLHAQSEYWRTTLSGAPVLIDLPTDRPRPAQQSFKGGHVPIILDAQLTRALKQLSQKHGVTLFMTILSAWSIVLSRLSGQDDIVIGTPSANRGRQEVEQLIGFFVSTLAMRVDLSGDPSTRELLDRVRRSTLAAYANQDLPFEQVVEIVQPPRSMSHTPLFQVMFAWQNNEQAEWDMPGVQVLPYEQDHGIAKFDLTLALWESGECILGSLEYATSLFDRSTIERHLGYLQEFLQRMVLDEDISLTKVDMLPTAERALLLHTWNETQESYPDDLCLHQLFEQQVERTPEAVVAVYGNESLTYRDLNTRANHLAHRLIHLGVKEDSLVVICVNRSLPMLVGIMGILKAGGAYVPLDPLHESSRLLDVLADVQSSIALVDARGMKALQDSDLSHMEVIDLSKISYDPAPNPQVVGLSSSHLAYVIYTSGSTGMPKGVMVEHRQVARLFTATTSVGFDFSERDTWCLLHSFAFDFSVWEIWGALLHGGKLIVVPYDIARSPRELYRLVCLKAVTVLNTTPSVFKLMIDIQSGERLNDSLRYVVFGGEALAPSILKPWFQTHAQDRPKVVNMYGITETTVHVTYRLMTLEDCSQTTSTIGLRLPDLRTYVLNSYGQPVPVGVKGELFVGGAGVTRGYLNRPGLTSERFLPDPFVEGHNERMYKTGDLVKQLPDGSLVFIGRNDYQVKIRGFRIELGEIETKLHEHPLISEVVVDALGEGSNKCLVAYVIMNSTEGNG